MMPVWMMKTPLCGAPWRKSRSPFFNLQTSEQDVTISTWLGVSPEKMFGCGPRVLREGTARIPSGRAPSFESERAFFRPRSKAETRAIGIVEGDRSDLHAYVIRSRPHRNLGP